MPNEILTKWGTTADLTLTSLASLADGDIWQSGVIADASPTMQRVKVSYEIVFNATPVSGDYLAFYVATGDEEATNEIWDGGIGETVGQITTAAAKAAVKAALIEVHRHAWLTSHGTTFKGSFVVEIEPSWQVLVCPMGEALAASGHRIHYRYATEEVQ